MISWEIQGRRPVIFDFKKLPLDVVTTPDCRLLNLVNIVFPAFALYLIGVIVAVLYIYAYTPKNIKTPYHPRLRSMETGYLASAIKFIARKK
jgi:hypothetical protein